MSLSAGSDRPDLLADWDAAVVARPDAVALVDPAEHTSYAELDARTDAIAAELVAGGIGPERLVGLDLTRPRDVVAGLLATLKAGGAFVLLDPALGPEARARRHSSAPVDLWLTDASFGSMGASRAAAPPDWRARVAAPAQLAYVVYTSGSTGAPKGIMIERAALAAYARALRSRLDLRPEDTWLQVASPGFDVFVEEVVPVLTAGGTLACGETVRALDPALLHETLLWTGATIVELTTQHWYEYARWLVLADRRPPRRLRLLIVGGERMDPAAYRDWQARYDTPLAHVYGLSECTVTSTLFTGEARPDAPQVPIGRPISSCIVTVRRDGRVVADGETGEIHVGGPTLGRGFLGDPAATAARFGPDPDGDAGARLFATGDQGVVLDGELVFLGREDDQVKVRGFRLELGEVEAALASLEGAAHAAAVVDPDGGRDLLGFVVPADAAEAPPPGTATELRAERREAARAALRLSLPEWALPRRLLLVDELPKTAHGKVDRAALTRLHRSGARPAVTSEAEGGDAWLDTVVSAFRSALEAPELGPDDDFFEFGGNSLGAMRITAELRDGRDAASLEPWMIFDAPTPRLLAALTGPAGS